MFGPVHRVIAAAEEDDLVAGGRDQIGERMRNRTVLAASIALAVVVAPICALAQDGGNLVDLAAKDPNAFVKAVQSDMAGLGHYEGSKNGLLDAHTISAINSLCRAADVLTDCQTGPLSPRGAAAVVKALAAAKQAQAGAAVNNEPAAPAVEAAPAPAEQAPAPAEAAPAPAEAAPAPAEATPAPAEAAPAPAEATPAPAEAAAAPAMPSDMTEIPGSAWLGGTENGLTATPQDAGQGSVTFSVKGVAAGGGWINVYAGPSIEAAPGSAWSFTVTGSFAAGANKGTAIVRMAAYLADGNYISELAEGIPMTGDGPVVFSGVAPDGTVTVRPYIQMKYPEGTEVDSRLEVSAASIGR